MTTLKLADDLTLPIDAATQTFAFIARKGAGKTYAAGKLVELLLEAHVQVVVLDTVGNWYGLRLAADGKGAGFDVPVLGGLRGDIPLEAAGGALIADIVVDTGRSLILDVSQFSLADRKRFATAFGERLWLRKKGERHPAPLHLVIEESQLIVPQFTGAGGGDVARMLGVFEEIIRLGRNYGIGVSMITQRPQSVNKEVLNQTECLLVGQINGAQEREALRKWITHQGMSVGLVDELPGLKVGTFYAWSPQWLNLLEKVQIRKKVTFDASATPKVGDKREQRDLKPLDLNDLQQRLEATIAKAKADDPRELRKRIGELERQIKAPIRNIQNSDKSNLAPKVVEKPILTDKHLQRLEAALAGVDKAVERAAGIVTEPVGRLKAALADVAGALKAVRQPALPLASRASVVRPTQSPSGSTSRPERPPDATEGVTPARQKVLNGLAFLHGIGVAHVDKTQLALIVGVSPTSGGYFNNLGSLRSAGLITYPTGGTVALTAAGHELASTEGVPSTTQELHAAIATKLPPAKWKVLERLIAAYPHAVSKDDLAEQIGVSPTSGGYFNNLGSLRSLGLVDYPQPGAVAALPVLFLEA